MSAAASNTSNTGEHRLLAYRIERLEEEHKEAVGEIRDALKSIDKSLQALAVVEVQNTATRQQIALVQNRLNAIEKELPTLKLVRQWVIAAVIAITAAVGYATLAQTLL